MENKITTLDILQAKNTRKLAMITAYDALFAHLADLGGADMILIGDSVGNNFLGFDSTIPVSLADMLHHTKAVARANTKALVVADMPFCEANYSFDRLLDSAKSLIQAGASAIKIEGAGSIAEKIAKLTEAGIAVVGHIGLQPQQFLKLGKYRKFGKTEDEKNRLISEAKQLESAGVFAIVLEMTEAATAKAISESVSVPTIGIGAGPHCDGQVLVMTDMLGLNDFSPKFAKRYANLKEQIVNAYSQYVSEVRSGKFPE